jgi:hypothetical protein
VKKRRSYALKKYQQFIFQGIINYIINLADMEFVDLKKLD